MSLQRIEIRNFQSLRRVDLDLGHFTVIVGPSSSGKSALMRACRGIASNVRGASIITRGQKHAAITVRTDTHTITLERTETSGTYRLRDDSGTELIFTKLNGGVPEHITKALRIEPVAPNASSVNFASQFDRPYLLDETGATVARVLGELTNVDTIFEAVRLANKRRLAASGLLKMRRADLEANKARTAALPDLSTHQAALQRAQDLHRQAETAHANVARLQADLARLAEAENLASRAQADAAVTPPDDAALLAARDRLTGLIRALNAINAADAAVQDTQVLLAGSQRQLQLAEKALAQLLHDNGVCPTCGQATV